jgi:hypothetical protein
MSSSSSSNSGGSDFHNSIYKLLHMTLSTRPSNPIDFASVFFIDEQHVQHELAHAIHMIQFFEENRPKFREQVCAIFLNEVNKNEEILPSADCIPLSSVIKVIKAVYSENVSILCAILEYFRPGQYVNYKEFEDIVELTVICLNFATYLKTFISDAINKAPLTDAPVANVVSFQFLEHAFRCLQEDSSVLPNMTHEEITESKWKYRASSVIYAQDFFQQQTAGQHLPEGHAIKLDEFLNECVSHYFGFISNAKSELTASQSSNS